MISWYIFLTIAACIVLVLMYLKDHDIKADLIDFWDMLNDRDGGPWF